MRPRPVLRIARWEVLSGASGFDRRTAVLVAVAVVALSAIVPLAAGSGTSPDAGIYRVGVAPANPYYEAVARDPKFAVERPDPGAFARGELDLLIREGSVRARDSRKGRAAAAEFAAAVERYNDRLMSAEGDRAAAFPVRVELVYAEREVGLVRRAAAPTPTPSPEATEGGGVATGTAGSGDGGGTTAEGDGTPAGSVESSDGTGVDFVSRSLLGRSSGTPSDITPPFPFVSLVLAFAFVVPMNFVIQAYASSILHERTARRGELLLTTPVEPREIVAGKTLPYFAVMVAIAAVTALAIGGGVVSLAAVIPVALLFLASAFVGALLARSHKELTFVLVTVSVVVTTYVFVPAIFTDIHPIAAISPLTLVVRELEGAAVGAGTFAFSTAPVVVTAGVLFAVGAGLYREEDLFAQRPIPAKLLDALANPIRGRRSAAVASLLSIPFVLLAELLAVATLFVLPVSVSLPVLLVSIAGIEEVAKSLHLYAGFERGRYDRGLRAALSVGALSGVGFFVGEKAAAVAQLVGLTRLDLGRAAFEIGAGTGGGSGLVLVALLFAPLLLHGVTASISAVGASRGRTAYVAALVVAVLVHAGYNLAVVVRLG